MEQKFAVSLVRKARLTEEDIAFQYTPYWEEKARLNNVPHEQ